MTNEDIPDDLTREQYRETYIEPEPEPAPEPAWRRFLTPTFRRWAYGLSIAGIGALAVHFQNPAILATWGPVILALFFVDSNGDPRS